jgi:hypothetical protein
MQKSLESKRTIVRIWISANNPEHKSDNLNQSYLGHISIEFPNMQFDSGSIYISLWPQTDITITKSQVTTNIIPHQLHTLEDDLITEHRNPEALYCFYTLDRYAMTAKFEEMKVTLQGWRTLGNLFLREKGTAENCASLAYKILQAGDAESGILPSILQQQNQ